MTHQIMIITNSMPNLACHRPGPISTLALGLALVTVVGTGHINVAVAEEQPVMKNALEHLENGLKALQNATADKGGHRQKAIDFTKKAIEQVQKGIAFDSKH